MSKKIVLSTLVAISSLAAVAAYANCIGPWPFGWNYVGKRDGGYNGPYATQIHCGNDNQVPGDCGAENYKAAMRGDERGGLCFLYTGSQDLGGGRKSYNVYQCQLR